MIAQGGGTGWSFAVPIPPGWEDGLDGVGELFKIFYLLWISMCQSSLGLTLSHP